MSAAVIPNDSTIRRTRGWAAGVLVIAGANGLLFNEYHALHTGMPVPLAIAFGSIPVVMAAGMSVIAAHVRCGWILKTLIWAVVIGTISLSVVAQYDVLVDYLHSPAIAAIYPIVSDIATIVALEVMINPAPAAKVIDKLQAQAEPVTEISLQVTDSGAHGEYVRPIALIEETEPVVVPEPVEEPVKPAAVEVPFSPEELDQALIVDARNYEDHGRRASADLLASELRIGLKKARVLRDSIKSSRPVQDRDADLEEAAE